MARSPIDRVKETVTGVVTTGTHVGLKVGGGVLGTAAKVLGPVTSRLPGQKTATKVAPEKAAPSSPPSPPKPTSAEQQDDAPKQSPTQGGTIDGGATEGGATEGGAILEPPHQSPTEIDASASVEDIDVPTPAEVAKKVSAAPASRAKQAAKKAPARKATAKKSAPGDKLPPRKATADKAE